MSDESPSNQLIDESQPPLLQEKQQQEEQKQPSLNDQQQENESENVSRKRSYSAIVSDDEKEEKESNENQEQNIENNNNNEEDIETDSAIKAMESSFLKHVIKQKSGNFPELKRRYDPNHAKKSHIFDVIASNENTNRNKKLLQGSEWVSRNKMTNMLYENRVFYNGVEHKLLSRTKSKFNADGSDDNENRNDSKNNNEDSESDEFDINKLCHAEDVLKSISSLKDVVTHPTIKRTFLNDKVFNSLELQIALMIEKAKMESVVFNKYVSVFLGDDPLQYLEDKMKLPEYDHHIDFENDDDNEKFYLDINDLLRENTKETTTNKDDGKIVKNTKTNDEKEEGKEDKDSNLSKEKNDSDKLIDEKESAVETQNKQEEKPTESVSVLKDDETHEVKTPPNKEESEKIVAADEYNDINKVKTGDDEKVEAKIDQGKTSDSLKKPEEENNIQSNTVEATSASVVNEDLQNKNSEESLPVNSNLDQNLVASIPESENLEKKEEPEDVKMEDQENKADDKEEEKVQENKEEEKVEEEKVKEDDEEEEEDTFFALPTYSKSTLQERLTNLIGYDTVTERQIDFSRQLTQILLQRNQEFIKNLIAIRMHLFKIERIRERIVKWGYEFSGIPEEDVEILNVLTAVKRGLISASTNRSSVSGIVAPENQSGDEEEE